MKRSLAGALGHGFAGGCLGGAVVGASEGWWVLSHAGGGESVGVVGYAVLFYAVIGALAGLGLGLAMEVAGRVGRRELSDGRMTSLAAGFVIVGLSLVVWRFLIRRDVFQEQMSWTSPLGLAIQAGMLVIALFVLFLFWKFVSRLFDASAKRVILKFWFLPLW